MRTPNKAINACIRDSRQGVIERVGLCKRRTREKYDIASDGSGDATEAWSRTKHRFQGRWIPGAFAWWTGGSAGHGHVAICARRKGYVWTVDFKRRGKWDRVKLTDITHGWGLRFVGFSRDIDGKTPVPLPTIVRKWSA